MGEPGTKETLSLQELEAAANMRTGEIAIARGRAET